MNGEQVRNVRPKQARKREREREGEKREQRRAAEKKEGTSGVWVDIYLFFFILFLELGAKRA